MVAQDLLGTSQVVGMNPNLRFRAWQISEAGVKVIADHVGRYARIAQGLLPICASAGLGAVASITMLSEWRLTWVAPFGLGHNG